MLNVKNGILVIEYNGIHSIDKFFKSRVVKYINISKTKKPHITQVVTKLVVSITLEKKSLLVSVEH